MDSMDEGIEGSWKLRYISIFSGQALSQVGSSVTQFIIIWWITIKTESITSVSIAAICAFLPQGALAPLGGAFADRYSRRAIMMITDAISALAIAILMVLLSKGIDNSYVLYSLLALRSAMQAFQMPASQASIEMLVPYSFLQKAAGLNQMILGLTIFAAAPIGAFTMSFLPIHQALWIDIVTALVSVLTLAFFSIPQGINVESRGHLKDIKAGLLFIWDLKGLRNLFLVAAAFLFIVMPTFTFVNLLITQYFHGNAKDAAKFAASAGAGMLLGGILATLYTPKYRILTILIGWSVSCFAVAMTALTPVDMIYLAIFFWFLSGFIYSYANAPFTETIQRIVPNNMQGRVFSIVGVLASLSAPIGIAVMAPIGIGLGVRNLFVLCGVLSGILCLAGFFSPKLMALENAKTP